MADGAVMLPGPTGQVLSELPSPPSPLNLMLNLLIYTDPQLAPHFQNLHLTWEL